jgi:hypothetical protein
MMLLIPVDVSVLSNHEKPAFASKWVLTLIIFFISDRTRTPKKGEYIYKQAGSTV